MRGEIMQQSIKLAAGAMTNVNNVTDHLTEKSMVDNRLIN